MRSKDVGIRPDYAAIRHEIDNLICSLRLRAHLLADQPACRDVAEDILSSTNGIQALVAQLTTMIDRKMNK